MATAQDVITMIDMDEKDVEIVATRPQKPIEIVDYKTEWPAQYAEVEAIIREALGGTTTTTTTTAADAADGRTGVLLQIQHVGSTSVPGLAAKDVIDVDVAVADPTDEAAYAPALAAAGFRLLLREPVWYEHRLFYRDAPYTNLHVFGPGCPEMVRHRLFRDWLRARPDDRDLYAAAKRAAAGESAAAGENVQQYNYRKEAVLREILHRVFEAHGLLDAASAS